jgi:hypothetical protein
VSHTGNVDKIAIAFLTGIAMQNQFLHTLPPIIPAHKHFSQLHLGMMKSIWHSFSMIK